MKQRYLERCIAIIGCMLCVLLGCESKSPAPIAEQGHASVAASKDSPAADPLVQLRLAVAANDWPTAWDLARPVLVSHPGEVAVMVEVAQVAYRTDHKNFAVDLLLDATKIDQYADQSLVNRAVIAMIDAGDMFRAIDLLELAVEKYPERPVLRRLLFDLLVGAEYRDRAARHGRVLVTQRAFDFPLLLSLDNHHRRMEDNGPMKIIFKRSADDRRVLIGTARTEFDDSDYLKSAESCELILATYPDFVPARDLYGRSLANSKQWKPLARWLKTNIVSQDNSVEKSWSDWLTLGDLHRQNGDAPRARRAFWEAAKISSDNALVWAKLAEVLPNESAVVEKARLLFKLRQSYSEFARGDQATATTDTLRHVISIAEILKQDCRLWLAEAWAAKAQTLRPPPELLTTNAEKSSLDEYNAWHEKVVTLRQSLVSDLRKNTPWQTTPLMLSLDLDTESDPLSMGAAMAENTRATNAAAKRAPAKIAKPNAELLVDLRDEAGQRGIHFQGRTAEHLDEPGIAFYATLGCGGGTIDFDLDGWQDLYLMAAGGRPGQDDSVANAMFRNLDGTYQSATTSTGTGDMGFGQGVSVGDINSDGFPDLLLLNYGKNRILVNNGDGTFTDQSRRWLPDSSWCWSTSGAIADLDLDGIPDVFVVNYCAGTDPIDRVCGGRTQNDETTSIPSHRACSPAAFSGQPDEVLLGQPDGRLQPIGESERGDLAVADRGLGLVIGQLDDQAGLEVFVANDMSLNHFFPIPARTDRKRELPIMDAAISRGLAGDSQQSALGSMGIAAGDLDRDGDLDFYVTNFAFESNTLHLQDSSRAWIDNTFASGLLNVTRPLVGFGTQFVDLDNDGWEEIVVTNGHVDFYSANPADAFYAQPMQIYQRSELSTYAQPPIRNKDVPNDDGYLSQNHVGRALWTTDVNRDDRVDLVITHQTEPVAVLINHTEPIHKSVSFELRGTVGCRDAVGSIVELESGDHRERKSLVAGDGFLCQNENVIRFTLPSETTIDEAPITVFVTWPNGKRQPFDCSDSATSWLLVENSDAFGFASPDTLNQTSGQ
ncbi:FG-GAP-like repeat-containing protein [Rubripirellula reticaptiva]|uniref:FG-GAP repeat protein n=1 Tax=Rubripirellula reticaptiva TaxID=2528013 RepID=A0A5C6F6A0_9BACT|nr:FG-GAP-like repeat-containing protein [Rubripirellula reticaptiva]TWU55907.1 FG-GAP repeat protein [Rubripirellula reticaptiva]